MEPAAAVTLALLAAAGWRWQLRALRAHRAECDNAWQRLQDPGLSARDSEFAEHYYNDAVLRYNKARASLPGKVLSVIHRLAVRHHLPADGDPRRPEA